MNARDIIDRLAALDEATVAEPEVEPDVTPAEPQAPPAPSRPRREPAPDPWSVPPDFEPGQMPHPKSEDDTESIQNWLEATQQPIQDWEWDGENLNLLMDDGSTETYTRQQLDEIGVFGMAFAESKEDDEHGDESETGAPTGLDGDFEVPDGLEQSLEAGGEPAENANGTLDAILGRTPAEAAPGGERETMVAHVEGEAAAELTQAVSGVVSAILGVVDQALGGEGEEGEHHSDYQQFYDKEKDKPGDKKEDKEKKEPEKPKDSDEKDKDKTEDKSGDKDEE